MKDPEWVMLGELLKRNREANLTSIPDEARRRGDVTPGQLWDMERGVIDPVFPSMQIKPEPRHKISTNNKLQ